MALSVAGFCQSGVREQDAGADRGDDRRRRAVSAADLSGAAAVEGPRGGARPRGKPSAGILALRQPGAAVAVQSATAISAWFAAGQRSREGAADRELLPGVSGLTFRSGARLRPGGDAAIDPGKAGGPVVSRETSVRRETSARRREHPAAALDEAHRSG